ncbi:MAG: hypothetical protein HFJ46_06305 [Clostridia bacterium]|nr:hypothetical protein [Clostridia bacterium]
MLKAYELLMNRKENKNLPAIILITDGFPTYYSSEYTIIKKNPSGLGGKTGMEEGLYNVYTASWIKSQIENLRIYNIAIVDLKNADREFMELTFNPSEETINRCVDYSGNDGSEIKTTVLKNLAKKLKESVNENSNKEYYYYSNGFEVGALDKDKLNEWFNNVIEDIKNNLNSEITIGSNDNITGVYQVDADNLSYTGIGKDGVKGTWTFKLAENNNIALKVTAAAYLVTEDNKGNKVEGSDITKTYNIPIQDIKDGKDPNLYFMDGQIKWNVRSEYKNAEGIAKQALEAVELHEGCEAQIAEVIIELPVIVDTFVEDTSN